MLIRPKVGEAVLSKVSGDRSPPLRRLTPDHERAEREAVRRAQATVRRLVAEHDLVRMWTLTQAETTTAEQRGEVVRRLQIAVKRLRRRVSGLKWLAVIEWHPGGHGWHVHMVVDRFIAKATMAECWTWGFVDARLIRPKSGAGGRAAVRQAASYVAKYLGKGEGEHEQPPHERGDQRYLRAEGMQVTELTGEGSFEHLLTLAWEYFPSGIGWCWWSGAADDWRGPPVMVLRSR